MSGPRAMMLATTWPRAAVFERMLSRPRLAQALVWRRTWRRIADAPFWRSRPRGGDLRDFSLTTYEDYRAALEDSFHTGVSQLSGDPVRFWSISAGSSGPFKHFPITDAYRKQFQSVIPPYMHRLARRYPGLLSKPILYFAGTHPAQRSPSGVEVGFISNFNYRHIPGFLRRLYAFPYAVLSDARTFQEWGPVYAASTDLSAMVGITPSAMTRFFEGMEARAEHIASVLEGSERPPSPLPPVATSKQRADLLRRAMAGGQLDFEVLWPSLQFVACWKAATCGLQLPPLRARLGRIPLVDATYSATEGWMNVPAADGSVGGPIHPGAHVVELLPRGAASADQLLALDQAEPGQDYEIVLSTAMGLVRYRLFDVVRCTALAGRTPVMEFVQKAASEISLGPAAVSEAELAQAMAAVGLEPGEGLLFAPSPGGDGLELLTSRALVLDGESLDRAVRAQNPNYAKYVTDGVLRPIAIRILPPAHDALARDLHAQSKPKLLRKTPVPPD